MTTAIILAAGLSTRMGQEKLLLPLRDEKILEKTIGRVKAAVDGEILVVTRKMIYAAVNKAPEVHWIINDHPEKGQSYSLKLAVRWIKERQLTHQGCLVFLGDEPLIEKAFIIYMQKQLLENPNKILLPEYKGQRGHPVAFGEKWLMKLDEITGDSGGKTLIKNYPEAVIKIPAGIKTTLDVDTPEDYRRLIDDYERDGK